MVFNSFFTRIGKEKSIEITLLSLKLNFKFALFFSSQSVFVLYVYHVLQFYRTTIRFELNSIMVYGMVEGLKLLKIFVEFA